MASANNYLSRPIVMHRRTTPLLFHAGKRSYRRLGLIIFRPIGRRPQLLRKAA